MIIASIELEIKKLQALQNIENSANITSSEELSVGCDGAYDSNDSNNSSKK